MIKFEDDNLPRRLRCIIYAISYFSPVENIKRI